jgi:hypothetical protein
VNEPLGVGAVVRYLYSGRESWPDDPSIGRVEHAMRTFEGTWQADLVANEYDWDELPALPYTIEVLSHGIRLLPEGTSAPVQPVGWAGAQGGHGKQGSSS